MTKPASIARLDSARRDLRLQADDRLTRLDIGSLLDAPAPRIDWLWDGYLEAGTICQLHGDGGVGKSILAAALVRAAIGESTPKDRTATPSAFRVSEPPLRVLDAST
jgi:hypothetical protein